MVAAALLVWVYGMWIAVAEDLQRGATYAVPAAVVLMVAAWRRGAFDAPPPWG